MRSCGIFCISAGALLLEVSLTRIFSVSRWYHFAFMVVSIALLGFGASGSLLTAFPRIRTHPHSPLVSSILFSVSVIVSFFLSDKVEMDPFKILLEPHLVLSIAVYYLLLLLPFLFAGLAIGIPLSQHPEKAGVLYGVNLAGSAAGCVFIYAFSFFGSKIVLFSSLLGCAAAFFFASRRWRVVSLLVCGTLLLLPNSIYQITMSPYKSLSLALNYPGAEILSTEWNAISRVDIVKSPLHQAPGLSLTFPEEIPSSLGLTQDGDNLSSLPEPGPFIAYLPLAAAYIVPRKEVLIIHPQGVDVAAALYYGAHVTVAEGNSLVLESASTYSDLYEDVTRVTDARTYLAQAQEKYDLIQISLSESLFASSVGLYSFNESYLFTEEAFLQYYDHLTPDGIIVINRWLVIPPRELPRLLSIILAAGGERENVVVINTYSTSTLLVKKTPLGPEIEDIEKFCQEKGFTLAYPGESADQISQLISSQFSNNKAVQREYLFNITPPTDDKPFFFNFFTWRKFPQLKDSLGGRWQPFFEGGFMAVLILVQALVISLVLIAAPIKKVKLDRNTLYFAFIGFGFMFVEISLIQEFILFLGQPTYSITFVLVSLLLFSGVGSYISSRISEKKVFLPLISSLALVTLFLPLFIHSFLGLPLSLKIVSGLLVLAPLSLFMGMPFPCKLRALPLDTIPFAWCTNGCSSVCGSVLAIVVALSLGFHSVFLIGLIWYCAAFLASR